MLVKIHLRAYQLKEVCVNTTALCGYYEQSEEKTICLHLILAGGYFVPGEPNINMVWDSLG